VRKRLALMKIELLVLLLAAAWIGCSDSDKGTDSGNHAPVIESLTADPDTFYADQSTMVTVAAADPDGDMLQYLWDARKLERIGGQGNTIILQACDCEIPVPTEDIVVSTVRDGRGGEARDSVSVLILPIGER